MACLMIAVSSHSCGSQVYCMLSLRARFEVMVSFRVAVYFARLESQMSGLFTLLHLVLWLALLMYKCMQFFLKA